MNVDVERRNATNKAAIATTGFVCFATITAVLSLGFGWRGVILAYLGLSSASGLVLTIWYGFYRVFTRKLPKDTT